MNTSCRILRAYLRVYQFEARPRSLDVPTVADVIGSHSASSLHDVTFVGADHGSIGWIAVAWPGAALECARFAFTPDADSDVNVIVDANSVKIEGKYDGKAWSETKVLERIRTDDPVSS